MGRPGARSIFQPTDLAISRSKRGVQSASAMNIAAVLVIVSDFRERLVEAPISQEMAERPQQRESPGRELQSYMEASEYIR